MNVDDELLPKIGMGIFIVDRVLIIIIKVEIITT